MKRLMIILALVVAGQLGLILDTAVLSTFSSTPVERQVRPVATMPSAPYQGVSSTTPVPRNTWTSPTPSPAATSVKPVAKVGTKPATHRPAPKPTTHKPVPSAYYANCAAVRAAGADPIHRGDPGYSRKLDRDGDGVGCE